MTTPTPDTMNEVFARATLGELVARRPGRARLFERLRFDYCCGGTKTLGEACRERGLDLITVCRLILAEDATPSPPVAGERRDWRRAGLSALCEHIVEVHHTGLRRELPQIGELIASVMRVHGPVQPDLHELAATFAALWDELEPHLELEEQVLFPACRALEAGVARPSIDRALPGILEHDHREVGDALVRLRELAGDYDSAGAICRTHRRLFESLRALELDLHQHVHEENNILLPRLRSILDPDGNDDALIPVSPRNGQRVPTASAADELPRCCQGWLAEQTHRGLRHVHEL